MLALLVEDDMDLLELMIDYLQHEGIECDAAYHGQMALNLMAQQQYDLVVTDINMPGINGLSLCQQLRDKGYHLPILMLTANTQLQDKLDGFAAGADDYLTKPFAMPELVVRLQALSRRGHTRVSDKLIVGELEFTPATGKVCRQQQALEFSLIERQLLELLMRQSPAVVTQQQIIQLVWQGHEPSSNAYKMLLYRLRKTLDGPFSQRLLHTVRGQGVALRVE